MAGSGWMPPGPPLSEWLKYSTVPPELLTSPYVMARRVTADRMNRPPYTSVKRSLTVFRGRGMRTGVSSRRGRLASDPVAGLRHGLDDRGVAELAAQPADRDLHATGERVGHLVPDTR